MDKEVRTYLITGLIAVLGFVGTQVWNIFKTGADAEFQQKIEQIVTSSQVIQDSTIHMMLNPKILARVLETDIIGRFSEETADNVERAVAERIMRTDTNKVSMRSYIGVENRMRDEDVLPILSQLVGLQFREEIILKKDVNKYIKAELKRLRTVPRGTEIN